MPEPLTITELRHRSGLSSSALRFYERKGLLQSVARVGGKRVYAAEALEQVALIDLLKLAGFTLSEIGRFVDAEGRTAAGWRDQARAKLRELDSRLLEIEQARTILKHTVACPADSLERCGVYRSIVASHAARLTWPPPEEASNAVLP